jgi:hypothetical protein
MKETMKYRQITLLAAAFLVLTTSRSFAPPLPAATSVTVSITGIQTANTTVVSVPVRKIAETAPWNATNEGQLVIERPWNAGDGSWKAWFDAAQNPNPRKTVSIEYSSATAPLITMEWHNCVPVRYQLLPE